MLNDFPVEEVAFQLVAWIRNKVKEAGAKGTILGLSGGLDSAVVAGLCKKAFPENSLGLVLPCYSDNQDILDVELTATTLNLSFQAISLNGVYDDLLETMGVTDKDREDISKRMSLANLKPRLRMSVLYFYANIYNYLVVGTSNKSELTVGYFTKYGDGGVDIQPLGSLVKLQVRELAYYLGVPEKIIQKPPSAGLWENQTDEGEMGFSYEILDNYILRGEGPPNTRKKIEEMYNKSEHKRRTPPIFVFDKG